MSASTKSLDELLDPSVLHLKPLTAKDLPAHPSLQPQQAASATSLPDLVQFILSILSSAELLGRSINDTFVPLGVPWASPPATSPVEIWVRDIYPHELAPRVPRKVETWFARRSVHVPREERGTATWEEFEQGWWQSHSEQEKEYISDVIDVVKVADWSDQIPALASWGGSRNPEIRWGEVGLCVYESAYKLPFPLKYRYFSELVVTARMKNNSSPGTSSLLLVQVPVDLTGGPPIATSMYSSSRHRTDAPIPELRKPIVRGEYVSVERVFWNKRGDIGWDMATASDAKGHVPRVLQNALIPRTIAMDVGRFMDWQDNQRASSAA
ncbi:hypothetical protein P152DRAFT_200702 [Eremomyces bilateralis CBS 781.70]|uniref:DUF3074 domain-containing protein n=1 Tax=Eremomyces bilateralis CBS 781.70 TaxID=1392243 RepID=A0A6G1GCR8_9PEZI|nr:uncharacterized protein P152DRAFT_200702 [Eremomyces bilateralis CBS 781.70]KAF1815888.1 hypothetical protein P152DRAFT_200702 [Eremomyces bilateralis CBS 781.70]